MSLDPTRPGDTWRDAIILTDANGLPVAPDSTPKAILFVNGSPLTTTVTVTQATDNVSGTLTGVANQALTGVYTLSATLSGRSNADVVRALVQATIATKVYYQWSDDVRLVQWSSTTLPAGAAPALTDIQNYSLLGPHGAANADGTTSMIVYDLATPLVGATAGRWMFCASTAEISRITLIDQNVGTNNWQYHVSPAFTSFTSPAGLQFAALNLSLPFVDGNGKAAATIAAGDGADAAENKTTLGNSGAGLTEIPYTGPTKEQIATQVEVQIMDEGDGEQVLQAIVNKINSVDADLSGLSIAAIASAVWDVPVSSHVAAGTFGLYVGGLLPTSTFNGSDAETAGTQMLTMLEADPVAGGSVKRLTAHAMANAPGGAGGGGGATVTINDKNYSIKDG